MSVVSSTNLGLQPPPIIDNSIVGGFNASEIIQAEMQAYEQPITDLQNQQSTIQSEVSDYQQLVSDLQSLQSAAEALSMSPTVSTTSAWAARSATSSDSSVATATAAPGTPTGSVQFVVQQLAAAESLVSSGTVASTSDVVTSAPDFLLSQGGAELGFSSLASSGLTLGQHTVSVTQASEAALATGTSDLASQSSVSVTSSNDTLDVTVNGTAYSLTLASGTYTGSQLLSALDAAISSAGAGGVIEAGYNGSGQLVLATVDQGSTQSLQVTGGTALSTLGLSAMSSAASGTAAVVQVDGTSTTLSTVTPGATVSLAAPTGSVSATVVSAPSSIGGSLISVGSLTATDVSTGNGSLADLVSSINDAGTGITASAVDTGSGYVLQLSSSATGVANDLSVDTQAFASSSLGTLQVASAGQDAEIQVGGAGGYTLSSSTDTFSNLLPGLSVTAQSVSSTPVTVTVSPDASTVAGDVQTLVNDLNTTFSDLQKYAGYNEQTKTGGPLMGSAVLQNLLNELQSTIAQVVGTSTLGDAKNVGITLSSSSSGTSVSFDKSAFEAAYQANPAQVEAMFTQGGTFSPSASSYSGQVSLLTAEDNTQPGSYGVTITNSATQATDLGAVLSSGTVSAAETLTITMGSSSVQVTTSAGESLSAIAQAINQALAQANMPMSASVVDSGQQLELASSAYGSSASFSVTSTNTGSGTTGLAGTFTGSDVQGTIDGVTAQGSGQVLSLPDNANSPAAGLALTVSVPGITSSTNLGTFTYSPGIAQSLVTLASSMTNAVNGQITETINNLNQQSSGLTSQIDFYQNIAAEEQKLLTQQFSQLQVTLEKLQNQSTSLSSALAGLP
ncbi:flagellar filament capping protein FliD [Aciditerrimonas ferrireducens]|uniref:Flagellar hook-associated protein 2 n=1 Tax=Aciditerrimonas ferrireducens TaxID=667306 RepID=A0ABV6C366_9ACTN